MKIFRELVTLLLICWAGFYGLVFLYSWWSRNGMRRCFRCSRLTWMSPRVRAVMDAHKVIFCGKCMPVGDQLADVAREQNAQLRRKAYSKAMESDDDD